MCYEIGTQVSDDGVWEDEPIQDIADEVDCSIRCDLGDRLVLNPLYKLVDGYQHMSKNSSHCFQRPYHIKAPACEQPGWWYGEIMSWDM
jgi:hypothetical protein